MNGRNQFEMVPNAKPLHGERFRIVFVVRLYVCIAANLAWLFGNFAALDVNMKVRSCVGALTGLALKAVSLAILPHVSSMTGVTDSAKRAFWSLAAPAAAWAGGMNDGISFGGGFR